MILHLVTSTAVTDDESSSRKNPATAATPPRKGKAKKAKKAAGQSPKAKKRPPAAKSHKAASKRAEAAAPKIWFVCDLDRYRKERWCRQHHNAYVAMRMQHTDKAQFDKDMKSNHVAVERMREWEKQIQHQGNGRASNSLNLQPLRSAAARSGRPELWLVRR